MFTVSVVWLSHSDRVYKSYTVALSTQCVCSVQETSRALHKQPRLWAKYMDGRGRGGGVLNISFHLGFGERESASRHFIRLLHFSYDVVKSNILDSDSPSQVYKVKYCI